MRGDGETFGKAALAEVVAANCWLSQCEAVGILSMSKPSPVRITYLMLNPLLKFKSVCFAGSKVDLRM